MSAILVMAGGIIFIIWLFLTMLYPRYYTRAFKALFRSINRTSGRPVLTLEQEEAKAKTKKLAPYMASATKIEQVVPGQTLRFKIAREKWGADFMTVELNPQYPHEGKKYILGAESIDQGASNSRKVVMFDSDNTIEIAESIMARGGKLSSIAGAEEVAVGAGKKAETDEKVLLS